MLDCVVVPTVRRPLREEVAVELVAKYARAVGVEVDTTLGPVSELRSILAPTDDTPRLVVDADVTTIVEVEMIFPVGSVASTFAEVVALIVKRPQ